MARPVPERPGVDNPDEFSRFEAHGIRVRTAIRNTDRGDRSYVELAQTARREGQEREQRFVVAFERLAAIESRAREIWRGEGWRRHEDGAERGHVVELSRFTEHGINVRVAVRPDGSPFLRLGQTVKGPDGEERTQSFDVTLERLSRVVRDLIRDLGPSEPPRDPPPDRPPPDGQPDRKSQDPRRDERPEAAPGRRPGGPRYYTAGRIVDYDDQSMVASYRIQRISTSRTAVTNFATQHRGMIVYHRSFPERPKLGRIIKVASYEQPAIARRIAEIEVKREENRTFIVARYDGDTSKLSQGVWFSDGKSIKRGEERAAVSLASREKTRSPSPIYLVIRRTEIPHLGDVVGHCNNKPRAHARARELEARHTPAQRTDKPEPSRHDPSQSPRSNTEWWRSEGQALRERKQQEERRPKPSRPH